MSIISYTTISDIHILALDPQYQWENLLDNFFKPIEKLRPDIIFVNGDVVDERVNVNSAAASVFHRFVDKLIDTGATIVIVEGTKSHDDNQINVFSHRISEKFRIYSKVAVDEIYGMKILFIPEEYMADPEEYYAKYLNIDFKYDHVMGHGMFDHLAYTGKKKQVFRKLTSPIWNYEKHFKNITHGTVNFGHIHTPCSKDRYDSNGSFGRYNHGEEEDKGFRFYKYDTVAKTILKREFIVNTGAKVFKTIIEKDLPLDRDRLMESLQKYADESFKLRIRIDRDIDSQRLSDIVGFSKSNLKTTIDKPYARKLHKELKAEEGLSGAEHVENKYEKMDFVEATMEFILENHGVKVERDHILKVVAGND